MKNEKALITESGHLQACIELLQVVLNKEAKNISRDSQWTIKQVIDTMTKVQSVVYNTGLVLSMKEVNEAQKLMLEQNGIY